MEASGLALSRIQQLFGIFSSTASNDEIAAVAARIAPLKPQLDDELAHDARLFARVETVYAGLPMSAPDAESERLVRVLRDNLIRRGAGLNADKQARLKAINARLAELRTRFNRNSRHDEENLAVFVQDPADLDGLGDSLIAQLKAIAEAKERPDEWAISITRPIVWPTLTTANNRELRERVWRLWAARGGNPGEHDNGPVMTEILRLRGEKAKLFGYPSFAHMQTAARMVGTPDVALDMMRDTWALLLDRTRADIAAMQAIADADGADFALQAWDRLYYAEKLRQQKFSLDAADVTAYLQLENIVDAMFWTAGELFDFTFRQLPDSFDSVGRHPRL